MFVVTFAAQLLGFPDYIPKYSRIQGLAILRGANYASGAAGIRSESGNHLVYTPPAFRGVEKILFVCCIDRSIEKIKNIT